MSDLIEAIARYETALKRGGPELDAAEADLRGSLCLATEAVEHNGTVYAPGYSDTGRPIVVVLRWVRSASDVALIDRLQGELAQLMTDVRFPQARFDRADVVARLSELIDATIPASHNTADVNADIEFAWIDV
jgi:hypothetical protein